MTYGKTKYIVSKPEPFQRLLGHWKESETIQANDLFHSADLYG